MSPQDDDKICSKCGATEPVGNSGRLATLRCRDCGFIFHPEKLQQQDPRNPDDPSIIDGIPLSPGTVQGPVAVRPYLDTDEGELDLSGHEIVVTDRVSPALSWVESVSGLVTETGDQASPGGVGARERRVPAIGGCPGVVHFLEDGQLVEINGYEGVLRLLDGE